MLYLTTREKYDAFTPARTLAGDCGPEGGRYLPYKMPFFTGEDISVLKDKTFGQTVADMLNLFFGTRLTAWDVECGIGRFPIKVVNMGQKVIVVEFWRNLDGSYGQMERRLASLVCNCSHTDVQVTSWLRIAIRIALMTAAYGEMQRQGMTECVDIAVAEGDFTVPMAVWYARQMGLPVSNIICACRDGSDAWNLLYNGQVRTQGGATQELERLIYGTLGIDEAIRFCDCCHREEMYAIPDEMLKTLRCGIFPAVVSADRTDAAIPNVYRTNSYILEQGAAMAYSGLMDYRAKERQIGCAMLMADCNPVDHAAAIASALNISVEKLKELLE